MKTYKRQCRKSQVVQIITIKLKNTTQDQFKGSYLLDSSGQHFGSTRKVQHNTATNSQGYIDLWFTTTFDFPYICKPNPKSAPEIKWVIMDKSSKLILTKPISEKL